MTYAYDPQLAPMLEFLPELSIEDIAASRLGFEQMIAQLNAELDESGVDIEDRLIPTPRCSPGKGAYLLATALAAATPGLLYFHGGGFVIGSLDSEHGNCLALCRNLGIVLVSVDYRLAPETPFPGGLEDCYAALQWAQQNSAALMLDPTRLGVCLARAPAAAAAATACWPGTATGRRSVSVPGHTGTGRSPGHPQHAAIHRHPTWNRPNAELSWDYYLGAGYTRGRKMCPATPRRPGQRIYRGCRRRMSAPWSSTAARRGVLYAPEADAGGSGDRAALLPGHFHGSSLLAAAEVSRREAAEMFTVLQRGLAIGRAD